MRRNIPGERPPRRPDTRDLQRDKFAWMGVAAVLLAVLLIVSFRLAQVSQHVCQ